MRRHFDPKVLRDHLLAEGLSSRTVVIYGATAARADALCGELGLDLLRLAPSEARQLSEAWAPGRSSRSHLRSALVASWEAHGRLDGPAAALRVPRKAPGRCRALPEASATVLAAAARARGDHKGLAVLLGLYGALRRAEIARVRWSDLTEDGWLFVLGKGEREAHVPVHPVLLEAWLAARRDATSRWVFPGRFDGQPGRSAGHVSPASVWNWIREVAGTCGLEVSPHELRHTAIATAHDATGDLRTAQAFARHARPETTALYTRTTTSALRAFVDRIDYGAPAPA